ncbi:MAG: BCCT family transporter, partial [Glutamicibacter protophormiae]
HEGSGFSLMTTEIPVVEAAKLGTERGAVVEEREVLLATEPAEPADSSDPAEPKSRGPEKS